MTCKKVLGHLICDLHNEQALLSSTNSDNDVRFSWSWSSESKEISSYPKKLIKYQIGKIGS